MKPFQLESRLLAVLSLAACVVEPAPPGHVGPTENLDAPEQGDVPPIDQIEGGSLQVVSAPAQWGTVAVEVGSLPEGEVWVLASDRRGSTMVAGVPTNLLRPRVVARIEPGRRSAQVVEGPHGVATPIGSTLHLQAVSLDGTWKTAVVADEVVMIEPECGDAVMAATFFQTWEPGLNVVACNLDMVPGLCEPAGQVDGTRALDIGFGIRPEAYTVAHGACPEPGAVSACCYSFSVVDEPNPDRQGTNGGGGNGGWDQGRPFRVAGESRAAAPAVTGRANRAPTECPSAIRSDVAAAWLSAAMAEHASVAAFARFTLELIELGAPLSLVAAATRAQQDEIRHTELALQVASGLTGQAYEPSPLSTAGALERRDLRTVTMDVVREGCINETLSALEAMQARDAASDPAARRALTEIADDEARHAELAWAFVRWALGQPGTESLREEVLEVLAAYVPGPPGAVDPYGGDKARFGVLDAQRRHRVAVRGQEMIARCASALA